MMKKINTLCAVVVVASFNVATVNAGVVTTDGPDLKIKTKGGFSVKTVDGDYGFQLGGRIQLDADSYDGVINKVAGDNTGSDTYFRRVRAELKGHTKDWSYNFYYNLNEESSRLDVINVTYNGWGDMLKLTMGKQKEGFGLDDSGSSKWTSAIERSIVSDAFDTGNNIGFMLHGHNDAITYNIGLFKEGSGANNELDLATTGRFVYRPFNENDNLLHLGVGFSNRSSNQGFDDFDGRLGVRGSEAGKTVNKAGVSFIDDIDGDTMNIYNLEAAGVFGAFHFMAEYFSGEISDLNNTASSDLKVDGYSTLVGWFLTGERHTYKTKTAVFDKVKPNNKGGAWEVFARVDNLGGDTGANVIVNETDVITLGVNWYPTENVKIAFNYLNVKTDQPIGGEDDGNAFAARLQLAY